MALSTELTQFLASLQPYDSLSEANLATLAQACSTAQFSTEDTIFDLGDSVSDLYIVAHGEVQITDETQVPLSLLGPRNSFGERALLRKLPSARTATVTQDALLITMPADTMFALIAEHPKVAQFFDRRRPSRSERSDLGTKPVARMMTRDPVTCSPDTPIRTAARQMRDHHISSICVTVDDRLEGLLTLRDMNCHVVVDGVDPTSPVSTIATASPFSLGPEALGTDVLHLMVERGIGHVPIVKDDRLQGIVTQTDLTRAQAISSADLVGRVARAQSAAEMAKATAEIPILLVQLVEAGTRHDVVTRLITDIADTATRRLLALAETQLGAPPVPYLWLACGSQGRQEQTGVSDQDNCLILSDDATEADLTYFAALAKFVSDGLDVCGYFYCPGDMMASNPRWCQPLAVWRNYFEGWIAKPNPEAQMLASVMFDLRPIGGDKSLFADLQHDTLKMAAKNSIFTAHLISNSLKHHPPLGMLRGLATIRSGEYRDQLDLKHNGVVPVVDLGRVYALQGRATSVNTRARLEAALGAGIVSTSGGADLLDAYDHIATTRLEHQAHQITSGKAPDNYLAPADLSDFDRSHLRDAFVIVKTMQSALGAGKAILG